MSDCENCPAEKVCHYPFKPTECVGQRKFWTSERRQAYEDALVIERAESERAKRACPRPFNGRPDGFTEAQCIAAGECGCDARNAGEKECAHLPNQAEWCPKCTATETLGDRDA